MKNLEKISLEFFLREVDTQLAELFYENIKNRKYLVEQMKENKDDFVKNLLIRQKLNLTITLSSAIPNLTKDFGEVPIYRLSKRISKNVKPLVDIIQTRRSIRKFSGEGITFTELSTLLHAYKAIPKRVSKSDIKLRNIPSAGALYPLDLYFTLLKPIPSYLNPGVYHYEPNGHYLNYLTSSVRLEKIERFLSQPEIEISKAAVIFYITGTLKKSAWKYGNRALWYMLIEAGHLAQNLCVLATALNIGICPVGGFIDDEVNEYLYLESGEMTLYVLVAGKKGGNNGNP